MDTMQLSFHTGQRALEKPLRKLVLFNSKHDRNFIRTGHNAESDVVTLPVIIARQTLIVQRYSDQGFISRNIQRKYKGCNTLLHISGLVDDRG